MDNSNNNTESGGNAKGKMQLNVKCGKSSVKWFSHVCKNCSIVMCVCKCQYVCVSVCVVISDVARVAVVVDDDVGYGAGCAGSSSNSACCILLSASINMHKFVL